MAVDYKLTRGGVQRLSDHAFIPNDSLNRDWQQYQQWRLSGHTAQPLTSPPDPLLSKISSTFGTSPSGFVGPVAPVETSSPSPTPPWAMNLAPDVRAKMQDWLASKSLPKPPPSPPAARSNIPDWFDKTLTDYESQQRLRAQGNPRETKSLMSAGPSFGSQLRDFANFYYGQPQATSKTSAAPSFGPATSPMLGGSRRKSAAPPSSPIAGPSRPSAP